MKRKILFEGALLALVGLILMVTTSCQTSSEGRAITVLNPALSYTYADRVPLAPRLDSLDGKTIYLYDTQWGGPEANQSVFEEMKGWFARNMPSVKVVIHRGPGWMAVAGDKAILKEIAEKKVDGILLGISG